MSRNKTQKYQRLSLEPLKFEEAVTDLLKVKPPPKPKSKAKTAKKEAPS